MNRSDNRYLIPTFIKPKKVGDSVLNYHELQDITFHQFLSFFEARLSEQYNWNWLHARVDAVGEYMMSSLLGFCHDPIKIRATQEMLYIFMNEKRLCEFLLDRNASYDDWARQNDTDYGIKMLVAFNGIVSAIHKEFQNIQQEAKKPMEPFISYIADLHAGQTMKNIREFMGIFHKPLELTFLLAGHERFNEFPEMLRKYHSNPEGSYERTEKMRYGIDAQEIVGTFFDGDTKIPIENYTYMQGMQEQKETCCLIHIPKSFMVKALGLTYEEFLGEFMPQSHEPLKMTLRIEELSGGDYQLSYTLEEPADDIVLEYVPEHRKGNGEEGYVSEKMVSRLRKNNDKPKGERSKVQKSLLGKTKSVVTNNKFVYQTKVRYFHYFLHKCLEIIHEDFGRKLGELRYLAYTANELSFIAISTPLTFPKILSPDEGRMEIIDAQNPTLLLDPKRKGEVIPNAIVSNDERRVQIITGPNQNGKSRFMDTIGLSQIMFQAGWPIFAKRAEMSPRTDLRVRYVHSGVGIAGESRFSNECHDVFKDFAESYGTYPLFLIDEPYTGTNYLDAEKLLKEILQACSEENTSVFLTTHFHGLIDFVSTLPNGHNLHCVVGENDSFTYKIIEGSSTKSNALLVAEKAGVRYESIKSILKKKRERHKIDGGIDEDMQSRLTVVKREAQIVGRSDEVIIPGNTGGGDDLPF